MITLLAITAVSLVAGYLAMVVLAMFDYIQKS